MTDDQATDDLAERIHTNTTADDGGPAYPVPPGCRLREGLTMRDWFAGQALPEVMAMQGRAAQEGTVPENPQDQAAHIAYAYACAMIAQRKKVT